MYQRGDFAENPQQMPEHQMGRALSGLGPESLGCELCPIELLWKQSIHKIGCADLYSYYRKGLHV